jgi:hypothetical protein
MLPKRKEEMRQPWPAISSPLTRAFSISLFFSLVFFSFFTPRFDTNDDVRQALIAAGQVYTEQPDPHLLFPNILLGEGLSRAYQAFPDFPFYGSMIYLFHFLGLVLLLGFIIQQRPAPWALPLLLIWGVIPLWMQVQYTGAAFMLTVGGLIQLGYGEKKGPWLGGVALLLASLLRWESFWFGLALAPLLWLFQPFPPHFFSLKKLLPLLLSILLIFSARAYHTHRYQQDKGWESFYSHNRLRAQLTDYQRYPFEANQTAYQEIGWDESTYEMYRHWFLADTMATSPQDIGRLQQLASSRSWWTSLQDPLSLLRQNLFAALLLLPVGLLMLGSRGTIRRRLLLAALGVLLVLLILAMDRWLHNRVSLPAMTWLLFLGLVGMRGLAVKRGLRWALLGLSLAYLLGWGYRSHREGQRAEAAVQVAAQLARESKTLVIWADSFPYEYLWRPFQENQAHWRALSLLPTDLSVYTPFFERQCQRLRVQHIHDFIASDAAFLVARPELLPIYQNFLQQQHPERKMQFQQRYKAENLKLWVWEVRRGSFEFGVSGLEFGVFRIQETGSTPGGSCRKPLRESKRLSGIPWRGLWQGDPGSKPPFASVLSGVTLQTVGNTGY